jgi:hypothetical protein
MTAYQIKVRARDYQGNYSAGKLQRLHLLKFLLFLCWDKEHHFS